MSSRISYCLCLLLALAPLLNGFTSNAQLHWLNTHVQSSEHVLAICTGAETKWIDSQAYFDTGIIVEVERPNDVSEEQSNSACYNLAALEHNPSANKQHSSLESLVKQANFSASAYQSITLSRNGYSLAAPRSPPSYS